MIIWRGWGILAVLYALAGGGIGGAIAGPFGVAVGLLAAAVGTWFTGQYFNQQRPRKNLADWKSARSQQLDHLVGAGQFSLGPGQPQPRSMDEARWQADELLAAEERSASQGLLNRHSVFWIPMQYLAFVIAVGAVIALATGLFGN